MTRRRLRQLLALATWGVWLLAATTPLAAWLLPYDQSGASTAIGPDRARATTTASRPNLSLVALQTVMGLDLRRAVVEGKASERPAPPLRLKLVGTLVDEERNVAVLQLGDGTIQMKGAGETVGDAELIEITETTVKLLYHGSQVVLSMESENRP